ncbi:MAG: hypothetical protein ACUVXI_09350 [bacterium]
MWAWYIVISVAASILGAVKAWDWIRRREYFAEKGKESEEFLRRVGEEGLPILEDVPIDLSPGEVAVLRSFAQLFEVRAPGGSGPRRGYISISFWPQRPGLLRAAGLRPRPADRGVLVITDRRVVFSGVTHNKEYPLDSIPSVRYGYRTLEVGPSRGGRIDIYRLGEDDNPIILKSAIRLLASDRKVLGPDIRKKRAAEYIAMMERETEIIRQRIENYDGSPRERREIARMIDGAIEDVNRAVKHGYLKKEKAPGIIEGYRGLAETLDRIETTRPASTDHTGETPTLEEKAPEEEYLVFKRYNRWRNLKRKW